MKNSSEAKLLLIMGAFVLLGGGALVALNRSGSSAIPIIGAAPSPSATPVPIVWDDVKFQKILTSSLHVRGPEKAAFTVVEFADFECPSCRRAYNNYLKQLEGSGRMRFAFHHYPWPYHTNAVPAAVATEAAANQNKFWPLYNALFDKEEVELSDFYITEQAKKIGVDLKQFDKDRDSGELEKRIEADKAIGKQLGIASTPTLVIRDNKTSRVYQATGAADFGRFVPFILGKVSAPQAPPSPGASPLPAPPTR